MVARVKGLATSSRQDAELPVLAGITSPLRHLDPAQVSSAARAETRNREVQLPPISTYRWWARRTEAVNGAIIDAVNRDTPGRLLITDPFAGGGVIPLAAVTRGHQVYAQDLNPWAAAGLVAMLGIPRAEDLREAVAVLAERAASQVDAAYATELSDGTPGQISHTFRVATSSCSSCAVRSRTFPHALVSLIARKERNRPEAFLACRNGHLFLGRRDEVSRCPVCDHRTDPATDYTQRRTVICPCGHAEKLEQRARVGGWEWEVVMVERARRGRRELALPTQAEVFAAENESWQPTSVLGSIPEGSETRVLLRHGFTHWDQLYPRRQRALLEFLLRNAEGVSENSHVVDAVRMAIVGTAEMAGHVSRWDRFYLKSYESMAGHRFNFTTFTAEPNVWGTATSGRGTTTRRLAQLLKSADWMERRVGALTVEGPIPAAQRRNAQTEDVRVVCGSSERMLLPTGSVSLCLTDPPYHDDVQYSELSLPLRAWAGLDAETLVGEAVVNEATGQLAEGGAYEDLLTRIFTETKRTLKDDGHLIFSYANRSVGAWISILRSLERSGLRAVGFEIVHSENETDHAKRNVRACTMDLIMDLGPKSDRVVVQHVPAERGGSDEMIFLRMVGAAFLQVGRLETGWERQFTALLQGSSFLSNSKAAQE